MFDFSRLFEADREVAAQFIGSLYRPPDLDIRPLGEEYLYRWYIVPRNRDANVYFHIQVASDPERPLHDHPWNNTSIILAGGYQEIVDISPASSGSSPYTVKRIPGQVVHRDATWAHRLILPSSVPYSMSLFVTGPRVKEWGFWTQDGWVRHDELTTTEGGVSKWKI